MNYHAEIWIPNLDDVPKQVEEAMAPYYESEAFYADEKNYFTYPFHWDWYQIGGRWDVKTGNIKIVSDLNDTQSCFTLVTPEGVYNNGILNPNWKEGDSYDNYFIFNPDFPRKLAEFIANREHIPGYLVTVDYHN